jgi:hypothetical protein
MEAIMQPVYKDGSLGRTEDYELERFAQLLGRQDIDHIRIFDKETGGKVGLPQIEEKELERMIDAKFTEREKKSTLMQDYKLLTAEFDNKVARRFL